MENIFNWDSTTVVCCILCVFGLLFIRKRSLNAVKEGRVDNGAQNALTVGVFFTFIGITIALFNFNSTNIAESIGAFLSGMKTAFVTSLLGMGFGIYIKSKQSDVIEGKEQITQKNNDVLNRLYDCLTQVKEGIDSGDRSVGQRNNDVLNQVYYCLTQGLTQIKEGIDNVNISIGRTNSAELGSQLSELGQALRAFTQGTAAAQQNMNNLADVMRTQISGLSMQLNESNAKQAALLESMGSNISSMAETTKESYENSLSLINITNAFHEKSIASQQASLEQLEGNTAQIAGMKESFDKFLDDMAKRNNEAFIEALNKSIQELNQQLTEQLGDNFRHLDESVKELNEWQKDYKQTIVDATEEMKAANSMFFEFSQKVVPETKDSLENINKCLTGYKDYASLNERFAQELLQTREEIIKNSENMKNAVTEFSRQSDAYIRQNKDNMDEFARQASSAMESIAAEAKEMNERMMNSSEKMIEKYSRTINEKIDDLGTAQEIRWSKEQKALEESLGMVNKVSEDFYLSISDKLDKYDTMMEKSLQRISSTLEGFDVDFNKAITEAIAELNAQFATITENTGKQGEQAVETLAGTLAKISEQMVENYETLTEKIAEVDRLLVSRGEK
ncbi:hypothetical protein [Schwartzia succinivorans]|jgi:methyl-accepting chemotaxis protein|uniref:MotA/TolQ/ExbB proton channel family protein n=1 Tax=Schwartzia succinivorans DSM 10502 TaxID=1123243 RepID=A0A1M4YWG5_9FIRM|nr:hypothetical protein [Schwartzia succinivorans]SHF10164.1 hypothetical protein SAMN02745190_01835 [Schwartzia succinivorans DSM 10502]